MKRMAEYQRLDEACHINMGQSPDSKSYNQEGVGLPFFQGNADFGAVHPETRVWCSSPTKIVEAGTLLISVRAPIGELNFAKERSCIGRGLAGITPQNGVSLKYIYYCLKGKNKELNAKGTGSTFKAIAKSALGETSVKIVSEEDQLKIIQTLDRVSSVIEARKQQLTELDNLIKARFVELFYDKGYPVLKWNDVFNTTTGKLDSNAAVDSGEYPFFTCSKEVLKIDKYAFEQEALLLAGNNAAGKYDVKYYNGKFNAYQRTYVLGLKKDWSYRLFQYQLENKLVYLQQQSLGGLTKYLTLKILGELEFIIPPKDKQEEFELFVKQIDKSKLTVQKSLEKLEILKKALMQKYFG